MSRGFHKHLLPQRLRSQAWVIAVLCSWGKPLSITAAPVIYVNQAAVGKNDGSAWPDAFTDLQDALAVAQAGDEIWVASGTYKPDRGTGDWYLSFQLPSGAALYGGFGGWEECLDERDWTANETILSGDLNGDDGPMDCAEVSDCCREHEGAGCDDPACEDLVCSFIPQCCDLTSPEGWGFHCWYRAQYACCHLSWHTCENSYQVVTAIGPDSSAVLDGFSIVGAYASRERDGGNPKGAGVFCDPCTLMVRNSVFRQNTSAGIYADRGSNITVLDSSFDRHFGFGVDASRSNVTVTGCTFSDNALGLFVSLGDADVHDCTFVRNHATLYVNGNTTLTSSTFEDGGPVQLYGGRSMITDCRFTGNRLHLYINDSAGVVDDCLFVGSTEGSTFIGSGGSVLFRDCAFLNNTPRNSALRWGFGNLYLLNCTIIGNGGDLTQGGGAIDLYEASAQVLNSIIWGNGGGRNQTREQDQIGVRFDSTLEIDYSIVEGWSGLLGGDGNFGDDPMVADLDGPDNILGTDDDDVRLSTGSPAINAGLSTSIYLTPTDLDGHARILCGDVDLGAYEFGIGDYNCDHTVNLADFANWPGCMSGPALSTVAPGCEAFDFNGDGDVDLHDFYIFQQVYVIP